MTGGGATLALARATPEQRAAVAALRGAGERVHFFGQNHQYAVHESGQKEAAAVQKFRQKGGTDAQDLPKGFIEIPSVTTIIKATTDVYGEYRQVDPDVLQNASERGNEIHEAVERSILDGQPAWSERPDTAPYLDGYNNFMKFGALVPLCPELKLYHPDLMYAGTIDVVGLVNGEFAIVDTKSTYKLNIEAVRLQLSGYAKMVEWWTGINPRRYVLHLKRRGKAAFPEISDQEDRRFIRLVEEYGMAA